MKIATAVLISAISQRVGVGREDRIEDPDEKSADRRELDQSGEPRVDVVHDHDRPAQRDRMLRRLGEVVDVAVQDEAEQQDDRVDRVDVEAEVPDEEVMVDPGGQRQRERDDHDRVVLEPLREGSRAGRRFVGLRRAARLRPPAPPAGTPTPAAAVFGMKTMPTSDHGHHERRHQDQRRRRPDRGGERHDAGLLLEEVARRRHQQRRAARQAELPDRTRRPPARTSARGKSILMPLLSAWVAKWMAMTGASAIDRPQFRYATKPPAIDREHHDLRLRPRQARQEDHRVPERRASRQG